MGARIFVNRVLEAGAVFDLPEAQARHVQVLRLQPGDMLALFDGSGGEWRAFVQQMGRSTVTVRLDVHDAVEREPPRPVTIAFGMPANERMDALVEKATELGVAAIQPLVCERSVLRLTGERAVRRVQHWQQVAVAASEQSGRTRIPTVGAIQTLPLWLAGLGAPAGDLRRVVLGVDAAARWNADVVDQRGLLVLSGPEGGLTTAEIAAARHVGFELFSLGTRVLRADTAPLAVLAWCALQAPG
ncbi:MAG: 16S rRNA (uracil(1498)-N(3))-methyltransferase [Caldimonas sp.]